MPVPIQRLRVEPLFVASVPYCPLPYNAADLDGQASCPQRRRLIQRSEPASIQFGGRERRPMRPSEDARFGEPRRGEFDDIK
jgi:hypothetical protein